MSLVLTASGRLSSVTNFFASSRTSMTLLRRANTGARGKEATKRVTNPNWMTGGREQLETLRWEETGLGNISVSGSKGPSLLGVALHHGLLDSLCPCPHGLGISPPGPASHRSQAPYQGSVRRHREGTVWPRSFPSPFISSHSSWSLNSESNTLFQQRSR